MINTSRGNNQLSIEIQNKTELLKFKKYFAEKASSAPKLPYCLVKSISNLFLHRLLDILSKLLEICQHCLF